MKFLSPVRLLGLLLIACCTPLCAQSCTPQSLMNPADRDSLKQVALGIAAQLQRGDTQGLRALAVPPLATAADTLTRIVSETAPRLQDAGFTVDSLWLFHAEGGTEGGNTTPAPVDFYCALTGEAEATFTLTVDNSAEYALAIVHATGNATPWQMSFILRRSGAAWRLSGIEAKPLTSGGHDGLWYWREARVAAKGGETLTAWLYLLRADQLLSPLDSMTSTNRDKLHAEIAVLHMPEISRVHPLEIDGGAEKFNITSLGTNDDFGGLDVVVHVTAQDVSNPAAARQRNLAVMQALLKAKPELRAHFHGLWVFADPPTGTPYAIEQTMSQIE